MNGYLVKLVFQITVENHNGPAQFDEQMRWLEAETSEEAMAKAERIGNSEEDSFLNHNKDRVTWIFIGVTALFPLEQVRDGNQVFGNTYEEEDAGCFIRAAKESARLTQEKLLIPA